MTNAKKPLPDFKNRQEMAEWFDTHEMTDYDFKPVRVRFSKNLSVGLNIRLDPDSFAQLRSAASKKGIGPTTLARMWIKEHLSAGR
jgi:predicted DNA binding CopG/RHH family protein